MQKLKCTQCPTCVLIDLVLDIHSFQAEICDFQNCHEVIMIRDILRVQVHDPIQSGIPEEVEGVRLLEEALQQTLEKQSST